MTEEQEREKIHFDRMNDLVLRLTIYGRWEPVDTEQVNRCITCSTVQYTTRLDDDGGTVLQLYLDGDGSTYICIASTIRDGRICLLMAESYGIPKQPGLEQAIADLD